MVGIRLERGPYSPQIGLGSGLDRNTQPSAGSRGAHHYDRGVPEPLILEIPWRPSVDLQDLLNADFMLSIQTSFHHVIGEGHIKLQLGDWPVSLKELIE